MDDSNSSTLRFLKDCMGAAKEQAILFSAMAEAASGIAKSELQGLAKQHAESVKEYEKSIAALSKSGG